MTAPRIPRRWQSVSLGKGSGPGEDNYLAELFRDPLDPGYAEAAARRRSAGAAARGHGEPGGSRSGGWRRSGALLTLVLVGLLLAVAYQHVVAQKPTRTQVRADLEEQIRERGDTAEDLQSRLDLLRDEVADLRDRELADPLARQLRELEAAAGLARVRGDGVVIRVDDGPPGVDPVTGTPMTEPESRILDLDLQRITNGLWAAGAEAIAVNGRRLTSNSTIRTASGAILVDRVPVAGPYEVAAIGPDDLADRFASSATGDQMQRLVQDYGITYEVRPARDLTLPAATAPQLHHSSLAGGA